MCIIAFIGCTSNKTPVVEPETPIEVLPKPLYTYVVEHDGKIDTIVAQEYRAGNFVGFGRSVHFYIDMNVVASILFPKNRELAIKAIK